MLQSIQKSTFKNKCSSKKCAVVVWKSESLIYTENKVIYFYKDKGETLKEVINLICGSLEEDVRKHSRLVSMWTLSSEMWSTQGHVGKPERNLALYESRWGKKGWDYYCLSFFIFMITSLKVLKCEWPDRWLLKHLNVGDLWGKWLLCEFCNLVRLPDTIITLSFSISLFIDYLCPLRVLRALVVRSLL